jgi:SET domain-containing protein|tara:strand:- start:234 stop:524 length:291 start_codon:yes stop_codon:yes gene_type:complete
MNYRPLPESLTIKPSSIEGLGLFAVKTIPKNTDLGMIHFSYGELIIRTPLGGFINHSEKPNCKKLDLEDEWHLKTIKEIKPGEELTLKYTMYTPIL